MKKIFYVTLLFVSIVSCKDKNHADKSINARSDIRFGSKFFSICISENGMAYVIKGRGSQHTDSFKIFTSDTSSIFKLDSANVFFEKLNRIRDNPILGSRKLDAPRVEIFYDQKKVYDAYRWDETFWDLFRPIMKQLPSGFNPFLSDENPFD